MKKVLALIIALVMVLSLVACGSKSASVPEPTPAPAPAPAPEPAPAPAPEPAPEPVPEPAPFNLPSPVIEYDSLGALNEHYAVRLCHPPVMGVTEESFCGIEGDGISIAQYKFCVNGKEYTWRCSPTMMVEDITGVYAGDSTILDGVDGDVVLEKEGYFVARWHTVDAQYTVTTESDGAIDLPTFEGIADELKSLSLMGLEDVDGDPDPNAYDFEQIVGDYQDSWSQRATATLRPLVNSALLTITWSSSAFEWTEWTMTLYEEDGRFNYYNCICTNTTSGPDGNDVEIESYDGEGYFELIDGKLCWTGGPDEQTRQCTFEKMP